MRTTWSVNGKNAKLFLRGNGTEPGHLPTIPGVGYKLAV
jgi:hypothetical protein